MTLGHIIFGDADPTQSSFACMRSSLHQRSLQITCATEKPKRLIRDPPPNRHRDIHEACGSESVFETRQRYHGTRRQRNAEHRLFGKCSLCEPHRVADMAVPSEPDVGFVHLGRNVVPSGAGRNRFSRCSDRGRRRARPPPGFRQVPTEGRTLWWWCRFHLQGMSPTGPCDARLPHPPNLPMW